MSEERGIVIERRAPLCRQTDLGVNLLPTPFSSYEVTLLLWVSVSCWEKGNGNSYLTGLPWRLKELTEYLNEPGPIILQYFNKFIKC